MNSSLLEIIEASNNTKEPIKNIYFIINTIIINLNDNISPKERHRKRGTRGKILVHEVLL